MATIKDLLEKMIERINTIPKKLSDLEINMELGGEQVQADWNQNDETKVDYVKNRPFYESDAVEKVWIKEQTVTVGEDLYADIIGINELVVGETYDVIFNGTKYECVAWEADGIDYEAVMVGNGEIYGGNGGNGEPFSIEYCEEGLFLNVDEAGDYTVCIKARTPEVHKLEDKYLSGYTVKSVLDIIASFFGDVQEVFSLKEVTMTIPYTDKEWEALKKEHNHALFILDTHVGVFHAISLITSDNILVFESNCQYTTYDMLYAFPYRISFFNDGETITMRTEKPDGEYRCALTAI